MVIYRTTLPATVGAGPSSTGSVGRFVGGGATPPPGHDRRADGTSPGARSRAGNARADPFHRPVGTPRRRGTRHGRRTVRRTHARPLPRSGRPGTVRRPGPSRGTAMSPLRHDLNGARYVRSGTTVNGGTSGPAPGPTGPDVDVAAGWGA